MSRPELTEQERARAGPRALKTVGSAEWCWQTVAYFKESLRHVDEQWRDADKVLEELENARAWEVIPPDEPYGSLDAMLKAEAGITEKQVRGRILSAAAREQATQRGPGGDHRSEKYRTTLSNIQSGQAPTGTTTAAALRRLRKQRPDLYARVLAGELSPHRAAVEAGFRQDTFTAPTDPDRLAATLRRRLTPAALDRLRELLG